jgi:hypothetical protein
MFFLLAFFLDFFELAFILVPLVGPVADKLGIDLIWFGVLLGVNMQTSFMHPPFGFALFYLRSVAPKEVKTSDIYWGAIPFVLIQVIMVALIIAFPQPGVGREEGRHEGADRTETRHAASAGRREEGRRGAAAELLDRHGEKMTRPTLSYRKPQAGPRLLGARTTSCRTRWKGRAALLRPRASGSSARRTVPSRGPACAARRAPCCPTSWPTPKPGCKQGHRREEAVAGGHAARQHAQSQLRAAGGRDGGIRPAAAYGFAQAVPLCRGDLSDARSGCRIAAPRSTGCAIGTARWAAMYCSPPHANLREALGVTSLPLASLARRTARSPTASTACLLYRANLVHSASGYFGFEQRDKRLTAVFFWMA